LACSLPNAKMKTLSLKEKKLIRSLSQKKYRYSYGMYTMEGVKMAREFLACHLDSLVWVVGTSDELMDKTMIEFSLDPNCCRLVEESEYKKLSSLTTPSEILVVAKIIPFPSAFFEKGSWALYFDDIQDPGNMGTILRTGDWFGFRKFIFSPHCADPFHPKVVQASMGSIFRCEIIQKDLESYLSLLGDPHVSVLGADLQGVEFKDFVFPSWGILCLGNEGKGLSPRVHSLLSHKIFISGGQTDATGQKAESLNVAVAAGIFLSALHAKK
jgi:RNA methyltransferase, TrmH family